MNVIPKPDSMLRVFLSIIKLEHFINVEKLKLLEEKDLLLLNGMVLKSTSLLMKFFIIFF